MPLPSQPFVLSNTSSGISGGLGPESKEAAVIDVAREQESVGFVVGGVSLEGGGDGLNCVGIVLRRKSTRP